MPTQPSKKSHVAGVAPLGEDGNKEKPPLLGGIQIENEIVIRKSPSECYLYWRDFSHLPEFMSHLEEVAIIDDRHSHWTLLGPGDSYLDWDAEIIVDTPGRLISWRSTQNAQVDNAGSVHFTPENDGLSTRVKVAMTYNPPAGALGEAIADIFGEAPAQQLAEDLERLKDLLEHKAGPHS